MTSMQSSRGRRAFVLTVLAFVWSIGLLAAALFAPEYGSTTLVEENGSGVLLPVAVPAVISAAVWLALWRKCTRGGSVSGVVAWTFVSLLAVFCLLALASIGMFVIPVAVLLAWAVSVTPPG
ncbi:MAG TPA: hypothetical protein VFI54_10425 [Solirubrobacteraceae bacterium]|nr:hypothetical protein [Solirubrobacteraceae bacterium]